MRLEITFSKGPVSSMAASEPSRTPYMNPNSRIDATEARRTTVMSRPSLQIPKSLPVLRETVSTRPSEGLNEMLAFTVMAIPRDMMHMLARVWTHDRM